MACAFLVGWMLACGGSVRPVGQLEADVAFRDGAFVIKNLGTEAWASVSLTVNDEFTYQKDTPSYVNVVTVNAFDLAKRDGTRFNPVQYKPQTVYIVATFADGRKASYGGRFR